MNSSENNSRKPGQGAGKKTYTSPQVQVYGDLKEITRTISGTMASDNGGNGGGSGMNRTS